MKKLLLLIAGFLATGLHLRAAVSFNNFDTNWFDTANSRINFRTNSTQKFWFVTNAFGLTGSTATFIRSDGTQATPAGSGGGTVGSMINTGANTVGNVPRASDTSRTNYAPSLLIVDSSGNVSVPGAIRGDSAVFTNGVTSLAAGASQFDSIVSSNLTSLLGEVAFGGTLSPAQITSDQNNYAPAGLTNAYALRLTTDANRSLTGIQTDGINGRTLAIWNANAVFNITFTDDDAGSTAMNRFYLPLSLPVTIRPKEGMMLRWSLADSRWRTLTKPGNFVGDSGAGGTAGLVPAPAAGDTLAGKFLSASSGWAVPPGGSTNTVSGSRLIIDDGGATQNYLLID